MSATAPLTPCECVSAKALPASLAIIKNLMRLLHDHESIAERPQYTATDIAERQLLGEIINFGKIPDGARALRPTDFANEGRGRVFAAMLKATSLNEALLAEALEAEFPGSGWTASLDSLRAGCYLESEAVPEYCRMILAHATRRRAEAWGKG
jgi:hypothetical protein